MIASVSGTVPARRPDHVVIDCGGRRLPPERLVEDARAGAGRRPGREPARAPDPRDDGIQLYGFATEAERELFLRLISVSGVGPKMALAALSGSSTGRAAQGDRGRRREALPGRARHRAQDRRASDRRASRGDRRRAPGRAQRGARGRRLPARLAREGLVAPRLRPGRGGGRCSTAAAAAAGDGRGARGADPGRAARAR